MIIGNALCIRGGHCLNLNYVFYMIIYKKQVCMCLLLADNYEDSTATFLCSSLEDCCYMTAESWELMTEDNSKNAREKFWYTDFGISINLKISRCNEKDANRGGQSGATVFNF